VDHDDERQVTGEDVGLDHRQVAVLGPGGVGGLVGGLLARAGADVVCLAGPDTAAAIGREGLSVRSGRFGDFRVPARGSERLADRVDLCFVTVKATQLEAALERVPPGVLRDAVVVPLMNGVEHVTRLRRHCPDSSVVAASIRVESTRRGPGQVLHESPFANVVLAGGGVTDQQAHEVAVLLGRAGLDVEVDGDESAVLWGKLAFLAPLALLTTHAQSSAGVVREQRREDLVAVVHEVAAVARAEGADTDADRVLRFFDQVPRSMQSSMQRDATAGRAIELEAIGGAVLRAAARHGLPVPLTSRLVDDLRRYEKGRSDSEG
jgi:2-dehydropantoate 2-reductase